MKKLTASWLLFYLDFTRMIWIRPVVSLPDKCCRFLLNCYTVFLLLIFILTLGEIIFIVYASRNYLLMG